jgi:hypothetical protein
VVTSYIIFQIRLRASENEKNGLVLFADCALIYLSILLHIDITIHFFLRSSSAEACDLFFIYIKSWWKNGIQKDIDQIYFFFFLSFLFFMSSSRSWYISFGSQWFPLDETTSRWLDYMWSKNQSGYIQSGMFQEPVYADFDGDMALICGNVSYPIAYR